MTDPKHADKQAQVIEDFESLKKTACSVTDVARWFKSHPEMLPGLPEEYYKKAEVYVESYLSIAKIDSPKRTIFAEHILGFTVQYNNGKEAQSGLTQLLNLKISKPDNLEPYIRSDHHVMFDALEWKFVAGEALVSLQDSDFVSAPTRAAIKNVFETHFSNVSWESYLALRQADMLPEDAAGLIKFLERRKPELDVKNNLPVADAPSI